jgi:hypothetical protein
MAELRIPIIGEFKGKKAFDDAGKATDKLDTSVKKLGKALLAAFSVQKITQFGKEAVKAFAENEKSAKRLETVVKNLGLAFELPGIEASLDQVSAKFGYEGEVLREAFQKLITTTGSAKKSQDLLNLSLDIAAGTGIDLLTVNQDLAAAYTGQTRGLRKYNLGLTQSELKTLDFDSAVEKLTNNFKGAGSAELDTYSGKMRVLGEAAGNAQEIIGKGLVDSFAILATDTGSITELTEAMTAFAEGTATAFRNVAVLVSNLDKSMQAGMGLVGVLDKITGSNFVKIFGGAFGLLSTQGAGSFESFRTPGMGGYPSSALGGTYVDPNEAARRKAEKEAAARAAAIAALQKKTLDMQKKANALTKAAKTIDLDRISVTAALRGKISETDRLSLNLQLALLDKNDAAALKLSAELSEAVKRQQALNAALLATPEAPNPYRNWKMPELKMPSVSIPATLITATTEALGVPSISDIPATNTGGLTDAQSEVFDAITDYIRRFGDPTKDPTVNVTVVLNDQEVGNAVRDVSVNDSLSGSFNTVNRTGRFGLSGTQ